MDSYLLYEISSVCIYKKNNAILKAGKIKPTIGTKIDGKKAAAIFILWFKFLFQYKNVYSNLLLLIVYENIV